MEANSLIIALILQNTNGSDRPLLYQELTVPLGQPPDAEDLSPPQPQPHAQPHAQQQQQHAFQDQFAPPNAFDQSPYVGQGQQQQQHHAGAGAYEYTAYAYSAPPGPPVPVGMSPLDRLDRMCVGSPMGMETIGEYAQYP